MSRECNILLTVTKQVEIGILVILPMHKNLLIKHYIEHKFFLPNIVFIIIQIPIYYELNIK